VDNNKWNIVLGVFLLITALATLFVAYQTFQVAEETRDIAEQTGVIAEQTRDIAEQSNEITERVYEILYLSSLPTISAIAVRDYDSEERLWTERIMIYNGGAPLKDFDFRTYAIMNINFYELDVEIGIPINYYFGYYWDAERSGYSQDLLLTAYSKNNYSDYSLIESDFKEAASKDGYKTLISKISILSLDYDYSGQHLIEYFRVSSLGSEPIGESYAKEILDSADEIEELVESAGLSLSLWNIDGQELWDWYKAEILQD